MTQLHQHVSAVSPLRETIDGTPRKQKRSRKAATPKPSLSTTWKCPACGRTTDDAEDQARHVAREFGNLQRTMAELHSQQEELRTAIPAYVQDFNPARLHLTEEDFRKARAAYMRLWRRKLPIPPELQEVCAEMARRRRLEKRRCG